MLSHEANPTLAALLVAHGFEVEHTGGGCTAWIKNLHGECFAMVTQNGDARADVAGADWLVGIYDDTPEGDSGYLSLVHATVSGEDVNGPVYGFAELSMALNALKDIVGLLPTMTPAEAIKQVLGVELR